VSDAISSEIQKGKILVIASMERLAVGFEFNMDRFGG
jgi:hypothetical protein